MGRQVPREWGRILPVPVAAGLYGARLGIGPLTILSTWTWWAVTLAAAVAGPAEAVLVGACFGLIRMVVSVAVSYSAMQPGDAVRYHRLNRIERPSWATINGLAALAVTAFVVSACSVSHKSVEHADAQPVLRSEAAPTGWTPDQSPRHAALPRLELVEPEQQSEPEGTAEPGVSGVPNRTTSIGSSQASTASAAAPTVTTPARLEDVVRSAQDHAAAATAAATTGAATMAPVPTASAVSDHPDALAAALVDTVDGFAPITEAEADRYLDLTAAAALQPDPTEEVALLETRGYRGGWTRAFRSEGNDVLVTSVYQFADGAEAEFYLEDGLIMIGGYGGRFFDLAGLPGVRGFAQELPGGDDEGDLLALGATFNVGPRWHLVYLLGSSDTVNAETLVNAVQHQRNAALGAVGAVGVVPTP